MGNYIFSKRTLVDLLTADAADPKSHHDFGGDILPKLAGKAPIYENEPGYRSGLDGNSNGIACEPTHPR